MSPDRDAAPATAPAAAARADDAPRRRWLRAVAYGAVGAAALGAGVWSWQRRPAAADTQALAALWQGKFTTPGGQPLSLGPWRGQPLVVNFWASWCPPCVRELPQFDRFAREYGPRGWRVVGLALDNPQAVREFLQRVPVSYPIGLAGLDGSALMAGLGNDQGALPFTVVLDTHGQIARTHLGQTSFDQLSEWTRSA
jgi:thiol-disulfide isomerase/thioredoxin